MTQYNTLNIKLSNSQLIKLKSKMKNGAQVAVNLSSNLIDDANDKDQFSTEIIID